MYELPQFPERKPPRPAYRKSSAVIELERLANIEDRESHPSVDPKYLAPRKYRDDTANQLTACIVKYICLCGGFASRVNNTGTYRQKLGRFTPSQSKKGLPDILATYRGQSLFVEVKIGRDTQSEHQRRVEQAQEQAGGFYYLARDFETFKKWFDNL